MSAKFNDTVIVDDGIEQFSIYNFFTDWTGGSYNYIHIETSVPAPSSYVMFMVEAVGYNYQYAAPIRCAWNIYTYYYDIGNTNNPGPSGLYANGFYSGSNGYMVLRAAGPGALGYTSFTLNAYPTAGAGARYPIEIRQVAMNNNSGNYF
jgi:hypothetical protein